MPVVATPGGSHGGSTGPDPADSSDRVWSTSPSAQVARIVADVWLNRERRDRGKRPWQDARCSSEGSHVPRGRLFPYVRSNTVSLLA